MNRERDPEGNHGTVTWTRGSAHHERKSADGKPDGVMTHVHQRNDAFHALPNSGKYY
jgi:hypothetical protein